MLNGTFLHFINFVNFILDKNKVVSLQSVNLIFAEMKDRLKKFIAEMGINQGDFAKQIGISSSLLSFILNGQRNINDNILSAILLANPNLNPKWLMDGEGEMFLTALLPEDYDDKQLQLFEDKDEEPIETTPKVEPEYVIPESNIPKQDSVSTPESHSQGHKKIKKIVFFYEDKTFAEYYPE